MVGQVELKKFLTTHELAPFTILVGAEGSGKNILARELVLDRQLLLYSLPDVKVETIRQMIEDAYKVAAPTVYVIPDADGMSLAAKNALLKLTEEPPNKARVIMTLQQAGNTLATLLSRAQLFQLGPYSKDELDCFVKEGTPEELVGFVSKMCETPGEVIQLQAVGMEFIEYVRKVVDNIATVSGANAMKIIEKLSTKADDGKYDLRMFWQAFRAICLDRAVSGSSREAYVRAAIVTSQTVADLRTVGINKQMLFDDWMFRIREVFHKWM